MKNVNTKFPSQIDNRVFAMDISIDQVPIMKQYYTLLNNGAYTKASEYLNNSEVFFYGAWCFNLLENRLHAIGEFLLEQNDSNLMIYNETKPSESDLQDGFIWIR